MKRTNRQIVKFLVDSINKHGFNEKLHTVCLNYFIRYDLTQDQCKLLDEAREELRSTC